MDDTGGDIFLVCKQCRQKATVPVSGTGITGDETSWEGIRLEQFLRHHVDKGCTVWRMSGEQIEDEGIEYWEYT